METLTMIVLVIAATALTVQAASSVVTDARKRRVLANIAEEIDKAKDVQRTKLKDEDDADWWKRDQL